jgi:hypothetical protein
MFHWPNEKRYPYFSMKRSSNTGAVTLWHNDTTKLMYIKVGVWEAWGISESVGADKVQLVIFHSMIKYQGHILLNMVKSSLLL